MTSIWRFFASGFGEFQVFWRVPCDRNLDKNLANKLAVAKPALLNIYEARVYRKWTQIRIGYGYARIRVGFVLGAGRTNPPRIRIVMC